MPVDKMLLPPAVHAALENGLYLPVLLIADKQWVSSTSSPIGVQSTVRCEFHASAVEDVVDSAARRELDPVRRGTDASLDFVRAFELVLEFVSGGVAVDGWREIAGVNVDPVTRLERVERYCPAMLVGLVDPGSLSGHQAISDLRLQGADPVMVLRERRDRGGAVGAGGDLDGP